MLNEYNQQQNFASANTNTSTHHLPPSQVPYYYALLLLSAFTSRAFMTMKALSSSSIVAAIIENTCAVRLKLLKACHRHLLQPSGENFDSRRYMHACEAGGEGGKLQGEYGGGRGGGRKSQTLLTKESTLRKAFCLLKL